MWRVAHYELDGLWEFRHRYLGHVFYYPILIKADLLLLSKLISTKYE